MQEYTTEEYQQQVLIPIVERLPVLLQARHSVKITRASLYDGRLQLPRAAADALKNQAQPAFTAGCS